MSRNSNEQAVVKARKNIDKYKNEYMDSLHKLIITKKTKPDDAREILLECQRKGNSYFNFVENFVGDSGLLGAHQNGLWITGFTEDCYAILESVVKHFQFLRTYSEDFAKLENKSIEPSPHSYANMQRLVKEYLPLEQSNQLKELFITNKLPFGGFDMPAIEDSEKLATWQKIAGPIIGGIILAICVVLAFVFANPTIFQQFIMRGLLAISLSLIATIVPGFINLRSRIRFRCSYFVIVAGGAIAIFVIIYLLNPPSL